MGKIDGKVALITGGARGQGADEARLFAAEGARVIVCDIREEEGRALAAEIGEAACFLRLDVTSETNWAEAIDRIRSDFGRLDILVNNAGVFSLSSLQEQSLDGYMKIVNINQVGMFLGMRAVVDLMAAGGGGSIINLSSVLGLYGAKATLAYTATKFAARGMTKVAALELASLGIRVNSIHPGLIDTAMVHEKMTQQDLDRSVETIPLRRIGTGRDIAQMALFLASDDSAFCTGSEFVCDGGESAG